MDRRLRIGIILAVLGIGLIVVGFFVLSGFLRTALAPAVVPTPVPSATQKVVITTHDLAIGYVLKPEDLTAVDVPVELAPRGTIAEPESLVGRITTANMIAGEIVLNHHLADPTNLNHDLAFTLSEQMVLMAFSANDLMTSLNILQRGDIVDIYVSVEEKIQPDQQSVYVNPEENKEETRLFTFDALQRIGVTAMVVDIINASESDSGSTPITSDTAAGTQATPQPTAIPGSKDVTTRALLLAISPQDALILKHLKDAGGKFDILLRNPTSTATFELDPVLSEYLIDRYQLQIVK